MAFDFEFGGAEFEAAGETALYWPKHRALLVADLHLEKASSYAKISGQMLPPYDSLQTLRALLDICEKYDVEQIICLGDNFHDDGGESRLGDDAANLLAEMTRRFNWHWIVGNHDPGLIARWGGEVFEEIEKDGLMLRHNIVASDQRPEISGHYHPKIRVKARGRMVSRRCFLKSENRLIMPAFGALTGGMNAQEIMRLENFQAARTLVSISSGLAEFDLHAKASTAA